MQKANEYFNSNDYVQSHEKLWASASYSVKKYFLQMGVKLGSHKAKKHAVMTMINEVLIILPLSINLVMVLGSQTKSWI